MVTEIIIFNKGQLIKIITTILIIQPNTEILLIHKEIITMVGTIAKIIIVTTHFTHNNNRISVTTFKKVNVTDQTASFCMLKISKCHNNNNINRNSLLITKIHHHNSSSFQIEIIALANNKTIKIKFVAITNKETVTDKVANFCIHSQIECLSRSFNKDNKFNNPKEVLTTTTIEVLIAVSKIIHFNNNNSSQT